MTDPGFCKANSDNLPTVDCLSVVKYFSRTSSAKFGKSKKEKSKNYGDDAIGNVQLLRKDGKCFVKAHVTPECVVPVKKFRVTVEINEQEEDVVSCICEDCGAENVSANCYHNAAFLMWLHRRSEEPDSPTLVCYWKKSFLASISSKKVFLTLSEMCGKQNSQSKEVDNSILESFITGAKEMQPQSAILNHINDTDFKQLLSLHYLGVKYVNKCNTAEEFLKECKEHFTFENLHRVFEATNARWESPLWHEFRYGRIPASLIYQTALLRTDNKKLINKIFGQKKKTSNNKLESQVFHQLETKLNIKIKPGGLFLTREYPEFSASPTGVGDDFVLTVKYLKSPQQMDTYMLNGEVRERYLAQLQTQMYFSQVQYGIFCLVHSDFANTQKFDFVWLSFDKSFVKTLLIESSKYWISFVYPHFKRIYGQS